jgi:hypothetical protein
MMLLIYPSKKVLRENIGKPLRYQETSMFGPEYKSTGSFVGAGRPHLSSVVKREFFAEVTMRDGVIVSVK